MRRRELSAAIALVAVLVAGCGGSSNASHTVASVPTATIPTTTHPATTQTVTLTQTTATATTPSGGAPACTAADLTPQSAGSNGAAGHVVLTVILRNSGSAACHTYGFPGVQFLGPKAGTGPKPIPTDAKRTVEDFAGDTPLTHITLQPGQVASFRVITSDVAGAQIACETAGGLQIIAPDDTATMQVAIPNPISVCGGQATVSPLEPGTSANPAG